MFRVAHISAHWLQQFSPRHKVILTALADLTMLVVVVLLAYALRVSMIQVPPMDKMTSYVIAPLLSVTIAYLFGIYNAAARNYSYVIERKIVVSQVVVLVPWVTWLLSTGTIGFARSVMIIYVVLAVVSMIALRRFAATWFSLLPGGKYQRDKTAVVIYGAGREGIALAEAMRQRGNMNPVAFLDNDYTLLGRTMAALKVYTFEDLPTVIETHKPREAIVAKSGLSRAYRRNLVDTFLRHGVTVKMAPALEDIAGGHVSIGDIRPIRVDDLLGRDPVPPDFALMRAALSDKVVMVTGAGGSIGSELVRQALPLGPSKLVLVDNHEFALFEIHRSVLAKLAKTDKQIDVVPILADVKSKREMTEHMRNHCVDVVFHAAAYKHVHMVQENAKAGVLNNVFGTRAVAEAAIAAGVGRFILISTDKAVRPTNIMGASKRVAELVVQALADKADHNTILTMVRFGNVLGSNGSVVPLFSEQIAAGGPVTVTNPDVTRFFMLATEAAQLVIQAGAMAKGGDVFVLDMGEPVRIVKLAETMIELAGLTAKSPSHPNGDIDVIFTGLKPGEKLTEELEIGNDLTRTQHERIMRAREFFLPLAKLEPRLRSLMQYTTTPSTDEMVSFLFVLAKLEKSD